MDVIQLVQSWWESSVESDPEKYGTLHLYVDYRKLCAAMIWIPYLIPEMDEYIDLLGGATIFSTPDANNGCLQVYIAEDDRDKTVHMFQEGLVHFSRIHFRLETPQGRLNERWKFYLRNSSSSLPLFT